MLEVYLNLNHTVLDVYKQDAPKKKSDYIC